MRNTKKISKYRDYSFKSVSLEMLVRLLRQTYNNLIVKISIIIKNHP